MASDNKGANLETISVTALVQLMRDVAVSLTLLVAQCGQNHTKPGFSCIIDIAVFFTFTHLMWKVKVHILHAMNSLLIELQPIAEHFWVAGVILASRTTGLSVFDVFTTGGMACEI